MDNAKRELDEAKVNACMEMTQTFFRQELKNFETPEDAISELRMRCDGYLENIDSHVNAQVKEDSQPEVFSWRNAMVKNNMMEMAEKINRAFEMAYMDVITQDIEKMLEGLKNNPVINDIEKEHPGAIKDAFVASIRKSSEAGKKGESPVFDAALSKVIESYSTGKIKIFEEGKNLAQRKNSP